MEMAGRYKTMIDVLYIYTRIALSAPLRHAPLRHWLRSVPARRSIGRPVSKGHPLGARRRSIGLAMSRWWGRWVSARTPGRRPMHAAEATLPKCGADRRKRRQSSIECKVDGACQPADAVPTVAREGKEVNAATASRLFADSNFQTFAFRRHHYGAPRRQDWGLRRGRNPGMAHFPLTVALAGNVPGEYRAVVGGPPARNR